MDIRISLFQMESSGNNKMFCNQIVKFVFIAFLWIVPISKGNDTKKEIQDLLGRVEFKTDEQQRMANLGIESVEILRIMLENEAGKEHERLFIMLLNQYKQFEADLSELQKNQVTEVLAKTIGELKGYRKVRSILALRGIKSKYILDLSAELKGSNDLDVRNAAIKLEESLKDKIPNITETSQINPTSQDNNSSVNSKVQSDNFEFNSEINGNLEARARIIAIAVFVGVVILAIILLFIRSKSG